MFGTFGLPELLIILVIILIIFGTGKLPEIGGALGKGIRNFRKATKEEIDITPDEKEKVEQAEPKAEIENEAKG